VAYAADCCSCLRDACINERVFACGLIMQTFLPIVLIVAGLVSIAIVVIFELRKTPKQEAEMVKREDKAMSKMPDDPREIARWIP
jgi:hypothetical protein